MMPQCIQASAIIQKWSPFGDYNKLQILLKEEIFKLSCKHEEKGVYEPKNKLCRLVI